MGCHIAKGVSERCVSRLLLTLTWRIHPLWMLTFALRRFLTEIRNVDGDDFPPRTLYQILICVQFPLEKRVLVMVSSKLKF